MFMYEHVCMLVHGYACIYSLEPTHNSHVAHRGFYYRIFFPEWLGLTYNPYLHRNNVKAPHQSLFYTQWGLTIKLITLVLLLGPGATGNSEQNSFFKFPTFVPWQLIQSLLSSEWEMPPTGSCVWMLGTQLLIGFWKVESCEPSKIK